MFNISGSELVFLLIIALVVLGPDKLPDAARKAAKAYADFKRMVAGLQDEVKSVLDEPLRELRETAELAKQSATFDFDNRDKPDVQPAPPAPPPVTAEADATPPIEPPGGGSEGEGVDGTPAE